MSQKFDYKPIFCVGISFQVVSPRSPRLCGSTQKPLKATKSLNANRPVGEVGEAGGVAITAVVFDIGGVIIEADIERYASLASTRFCCQEEDLRKVVRARLGPLEDGKIDSETFWAGVGETLVASGKGKAVPPSLLKGLWRNVLKDTMKINPQMTNLCGELQRRGLIVAALSNTIVEHAEYLATAGIYRPFSPCILSCAVGLHKPDKAIYQLTAKAIGKPLKECLFIDDSKANVEGARSAGMAVHHFTGVTPLVQELRRHKLL